MINVWISYREEMWKEEKKIEMDPVALTASWELVDWRRVENIINRGYRDFWQKDKNAKTNKNETKSLQKYHWVCLVLGIYWWRWSFTQKSTQTSVWLLELHGYTRQNKNRALGGFLYSFWARKFNCQVESNSQESLYMVVWVQVRTTYALDVSKAGWEHHLPPGSTYMDTKCAT